MQEIHAIGGGKLLGGGGGRDRRMRPHQNYRHHQALKCPRCDSLNTKFCYYNNYNLSQPRHFCKSCRRYWTKGGVLRNVPVGGGSHKSKRSNNNNKSPSSTTSQTAPATTQTLRQPHPQPPERKSNSHSSNESSTPTVAATEAMLKTPISNAASNVFLFGFGNHVLDASSFRFGITHGGNDRVHVAHGGGSLGECQWQQLSSDNCRHEEFATASLLDHAAVPLEFSSSSLQNKSAHGGFGSFDWHGGAEQSFFDLPNTVDQPYSWAHPHWSDHDNPSLFHLP